jgi:FkbM family methyltransferase
MKKLKTTITENIDGKFILLSNDAIAQNILEGKRWEPHFSYITSKLLKTGNIAIDVGANFGYHTISLSNLVGDSGKVYSFEPQTIIFYQLCGNIFLNGLMNVIPQNLAVGDVSCEVSMNPVDYFAGWVNIGDTSVASIGNSISCEPLDYCLPTEEKIDFIKIDVQGYECKVLEGASEILKMDKPYLYIEIEENK